MTETAADRRKDPSPDEVDCWTPGRIIEHLERGLIVPADWRERLTKAGYQLPPAD